jgi:serine/threonine protein kinase
MMFGRYRVVREIGRGGMGRVYLAVTPARVGPGEQRVALKVVSAARAADPRFRARFLREAQALARVEHPNVLPVMDIQEDSERLYLVTRYAPGGDLRRVLRDRRALTPREAAHVALQVAGALEAAHLAGVVHRDVKPGNVLLADRDRLDVYLGDFGLAQPLGETRLTQVHECIGTPDYMAPEQRLGLQIDPRTDLWALGLMLREMLTGDPRSTVDPTGAAVTPTGRLLAVADGATRPDPAHRFPSADAMAAAIRQAQEGGDPAGSPAGEPAGAPVPAAVAASPVPSPPAIPSGSEATTVVTGRPARPSRGRRLAVRASAAIGIALLVGGAAAGGTYLATRDKPPSETAQQRAPVESASPTAASPSPSTAPSTAAPSPSEEADDSDDSGQGQPAAAPPSRPADDGPDGEIREVCAKDASVRDKPASRDEGAKDIATVFEGDKVEFFGRSGAWSEVETSGGVHGFMLNTTIAENCGG